MATIHEAKTRIQDFFQEELEKEKEAVHFLDLAKSESGWQGIVEVTEQNEYLKKLGYPPVFDKNRYTVEMDESFNIIRYGREKEE